MSKEAMKLALEAMGLIGADLVCEAAHHEKADRHGIGEPCPIQARWHHAFATLQEALAEQPAQQDSTCSNALRAQGKAYPRTCKKCGLGPCIELAQQAIDKKAENARELGLDYEPAQQEPVALKCGAIIEVFGKDWRLEYMSLPVGKHKLYTQQYTYTTPEQEPVAWKLVPRDATDEMLKAMDECSTEGYDERLYAGHAASVYMAAVDDAPSPPQPKEPEQDPVVWMYVNRSTHETIFQRHMRSFVDHGNWTETPLYSEPLANHELNCVCGAVWCGDEMVHLPHKSTPPQRTWVGLTDEEKRSVCRVDPVYAPDGVVTRNPIEYRKELQGVALMAVRKVEAKLKEKNT
jgi:hypothetical protein